jgi:hypothetical protein
MAYYLIVYIYLTSVATDMNVKVTPIVKNTQVRYLLALLLLKCAEYLCVHTGMNNGRVLK